MARTRSPERDKARKIWLDSGGKLTAKEVADKTKTKPEQIRKWKSLDAWQQELEERQAKKQRGGQPGNKNAQTHGAPLNNINAQTHGAYATARLKDLPPEQRAYIEALTLDTEANMLIELKLLMTKEADLHAKIRALEDGDASALYVDRVVEMCVPKGTERLKAQLEKLEGLKRQRDDLEWDMDGEKPATPTQKKRLEKLYREIAELEDQTNDAESDQSKAAFKVNMQTVMKASVFDRAMKLEAEANKTHGRIIKLLDSIKSYEIEQRRVRLEERKYNLAKQKLAGAYDVDPESGEIDDENDELSTEIDV